MKDFKQFQIAETSKVVGGRMTFGQQSTATFSVVINTVGSDKLTNITEDMRASSGLTLDLIINWKDDLLSGRSY